MPKDLEPHLVRDNYATHKTPAIHHWLLRHPRFHLHFTPTSSSWLNLLERWFAELTNRKLRRSAHRSVTQLEADIRKWINEWNKDPRPFVWTKTADEILETLAAYCERINDSGHGSLLIREVEVQASACRNRVHQGLQLRGRGLVRPCLPPALQRDPGGKPGAYRA